MKSAANVNILYQRACGRAILFSQKQQEEGQNFYAGVLRTILKERTVTRIQDLGIHTIPTELIVGMYEDAEKAKLYTKNLLPMAEPKTATANRWREACRQYLRQEADACTIECYEYRGQFFVRGSLEKVSVLKFHDVRAVKAHVIRVYTAADSADDMLYTAFLRHFDLTGLYQIRLYHPQYFMKLQTAMGKLPHEHWTDYDRKYFMKAWPSIEAAFRSAYDSCLNLTAADALCVLLDKYPFELIAQLEPWILSKMFQIFWKDLSALSTSGASLGRPGLKAIEAF